MLETVVSLTLIVLVFTTTITIIVNARNQTLAANEKIVAVEVGTRIRDNIENNSNYTSMSGWIGLLDKTIDIDNCPAMNPPFSCDLLSYDINNVEYDKTITVVFYAQSADDLEYGVINFTVFIEYYKNREIEINGVVYEE